jgi:hypothetical protein
MRDQRPVLPAPADYSAEAKKLWADVLEGWDLDAPGIAILDAGLRSRMRMREAQGLLKKDGLTLTDRFGQQKPHPAAVIERDAGMSFLRAMKALNLDLEPLRDRPGRPPGLRRGGA